MKRYIHCILLFVFLILCVPKAQSVEYYFKRISIEHGLSYATVNTILRDYRGTLWVGTQQGLNRVDRNNIKKYFSPLSDGQSLQGCNILHLFEDKTHSLWVITEQGLYLYNPAQDTFILKLNQPIHAITHIVGGFLVGGYSKIYQYDYKNKSIRRLPLYKEKNSTKGDYLITFLQPLDRHTVLVGTETDGIYTYSLKNAGLRPLITHGVTPLSSLFWDKERGEIYLSVFQKGLFRYNRSGQLLEHYNAENSMLSNNIILDIKKYRKCLWLATDGGGITVLDVEKKHFDIIRHIPGAIHSLPMNSIKTLYEDNNGNLWAGTVRDGLFQLKETYIKTYTDGALGSSNGLSERVVISIFEDKTGNIWVGTDGGGLNRFSPDDNIFTHHLNTYNDKIVSITDFTNDCLLLSRYGKGLTLYDVNSRRYSPFIIIDKQINIEECLSGFVPSAYKIAPSTILILAKNAYFYHMDTHTFEKLRFAHGVMPRFSMQLVYNDGQTTLTAKANILYRIDAKGEIQPLLTLNKHLQITSVCYEKAVGRLWIATSNGLYTCLLKAPRQVKKVKTNMFGRISAMQLDTESRLWINASNMLFSYNIKNGKCMIWDDTDGFLPNNILTLYVNPSSSPTSAYIFMGGVNGLVKINKKITANSQTPIDIYLQSIEYDGKQYTPETFPHKIPQDFNSLRINVGLNEKDMFRHLLFRYRIKGSIQNSVSESYNAALDISSLAAGDYKVYVSCMTKDGNWTKEIPIVSFNVMQPWFKQLWFILTVICLVLVSTMLAIWWFIRRNQQRLKWKMAIHRQALNEDKIQFLTNISHELRTPLTLIHAPLKRLLHADDGIVGRQRRQIESIFRQADHMKNIINWILEYDKNTSLSDTLSLSFVDINRLVENVLDDFEQEFKEKHIRTVLLLDKTMRPIELDSAKIRVVISNLLMNALKFSKEEGTVTIRSSIKENRLRLQIEDQGIGLKGVNMDRLFTRFYQGKHSKTGSGIGLAYCKELIERHAGNIGAYENPSGGTIVFFEIPYNVQSVNTFCPDDTADSPNPPVPVSVQMLNLSAFSVLIVDDNKEFLQFLHAELHPLFKHVFKAKEGKEALLILKNRHPDIVISDVMMLGMDGYQLCRHIKEDIDISHIPVILLTAKSDDESCKIGYKLGADAYLAKPFDMELLVSVIETQLRNKELLKQKYRQEPFTLSPQIDTSSNADERFMLKLNTIIKEHYADSEFDIARITEAMGMSRASLYDKMQQLTGLGINEYLNKYRIAVACTLLKDTDMSISDVAFKTGFSSPRYFSTVFKVANGQTPSSYRDKHHKAQ